MTDPWSYLILAGSFIFTIFLSVLLLVKKGIKHTSIKLVFFCLMIMLILAGLLISRFYPHKIHLSDYINFSFSQNGLWIALATNLFCTILFMVWNQNSHKDISRQEAACSILSLYAVNIAFFSGNFLLRYIFLELLALGIVSLLLLNRKLPSAFQHAPNVFILLKLADLSMLIGILIMETQTGELEIQTALELSKNLPVSILSWVQAGFIIAALIKMGVWPFDSWLVSSKSYSNSSLTWFSTIAMPTMGLYLLYLITPTFPISKISDILFYSSALLILVSGIYSLHKPIKGQPLLLNSLLGGLGLMFVSFGSTKVLFWYLIFNLLIRTGFELILKAKKQHKTSYVFWGLISAILLAGIVWQVWALATLPQIIIYGLAILLIFYSISRGQLQSIPQLTMEQHDENRTSLLSSNNLCSRLLTRVQNGIIKFGMAKIGLLAMSAVRWLYLIGEVKFMEFLTTWGTKTINFSFGTFEELGFTQGGRKMITKFINSSQRLSMFENRSFRKNLLWIPIVLLVLVLFLTLYPTFNLEIR